MDSYSKLKQISMENLAKDEEILNLKSEVLNLKRELISKSEGLVRVVAAIQETGFSQELELRLGTTLKAICPELEESEKGKDDQTSRSATKTKNKAKEKQITPAKGKEKQPSPKKLKVKDLDPITTSVEPFKKEVELVSKYALKDLGQVEAWNSIIKNSHPGSLSSLRKQQRDTIQECIEDYLKQNVYQIELGRRRMG